MLNCARIEALRERFATAQRDLGQDLKPRRAMAAFRLVTRCPRWLGSENGSI